MAAKRERRYLKKGSSSRSQLGEDVDRLLMLVLAGVVIYWIATSGSAAQQITYQYQPY